ncbi:MAG: DUF6456 domain-containing protein [Pseudomonadota bacterium]
MTALAIPGEAIASYLAHVVDGCSLRDVARSGGGSASTVLRRIQRCEILRDHPEWDRLFTALEVARANTRARPTRAVTREIIAAAMGLTEVDVHAMVAEGLPALTRSRAQIVASDQLPMTSIVVDDEPMGQISRAALTCALAFGWVQTRGVPAARLRRFAPTPSLVEAAYPPGSGPHTSASFGSPSAPMSMHPVDVLARRCPALFTADHRELADYFGEVFADRATTRKAEWDTLAAGLPPRHLRLLEEVVGHGTRLEAVEKAMGLPLRSGKVLLAFALEAFAHVTAPPERAA